MPGKALYKDNFCISVRKRRNTGMKDRSTFAHFYYVSFIEDYKISTSQQNSSKQTEPWDKDKVC